MAPRLFTLFLLPVLLVAQSTQATLEGYVYDQTGLPLDAVQIQVVGTDGGPERQTVTDAAGRFFIPALAPGEYSVTADLFGFQTQTRSGLQLSVARPGRLDMVLAVGAVTDELVVRAEPAANSSAEVSDLIDERTLVGIPLNGRQYTDLALLSDNVTLVPRGTRGAALGQAGRGFAVAGQRAGHNMYFLDGVSITDQYFNNLAVSPSVDAVREFNIQKSIYAPEYGGKASAVVSAATKSGGNDWHGSLYEFFRNNALDARNYFDPAGQPIPPLRQNQFGATLGGPLRRNRPFVFAGYEGYRERRSQTATFSLPSPAVRAGDFSGVGPIFDPTGATGPAGARDRLLNDRIPTGRLDPVATAFLGNVPLPTAAGEVQNYTATPTFENDADQANVRVDHYFGEKDRVFARYTDAKLVTFRPLGSTDLNELLVPGFGSFVTTRTQNLALSETHVVSPNSVYEIRFGWLRVNGGQASENQGVDFASAAGLRGVTNDPARRGFPAFSFADEYSDVGDPATLVSRRNTSFDFFQDFTHIRGAHTIKFGSYLYRLYFRPQNSPNTRGAFDFTPRFTSSAAGLADGSAFADFLFGYPSTAAGGFGRGEQDSRTWWSHVYLQDEYRARNNLTLSLGVRYESNRHLRESGDRLSNIELDRFVLAGDEVHPDGQDLLRLIPTPYATSDEAGVTRGLLTPSYGRVAPRFGLVWSPGAEHNFVVRAGYGLFFNQWAYSVQTVLMQNLPYYLNKAVSAAADDFFPTQSTAAILEAPGTAAGGGAAMVPGYRSEYAQSWTLNLEQRLTRNWAGQLTYFGSKVVGADNSTFQNVPEPGPGPIDARRPNPSLSAIRTIHWDGYSSYQAFTAKVSRRYGDGLSMQANYTWSKSIDDASSPGPTFHESNFPQNVRNIAAEHALSSFDHRHRLVVSFDYEPRLERWVSGWARPALRSWRLTGVGFAQTGAPFNVNLPSDVANIGPGPSQRPDVLYDPNLPASGRGADHWFDTAAFQQPAPFTFGNAGRNIVFADGLAHVDVTLARTVRLFETAELQFRGEAFNLFNHTNFSDAPGRIAFTPSFGRYFRAENSRQVQIGLKLLF